MRFGACRYSRPRVFFIIVLPLGNWTIQIIILLPAIISLFVKPVTSIFIDYKKTVINFHPVIIFLFVCCLLMLLVMSSWTITHPHTLTYHAQTIQWIEKYKVVPGLAHLHVRFGYQGLWFVCCAIFSYKFIGIEGLTFINSTVLIWYFLFIAQKINENIFEDSGNGIDTMAHFSSNKFLELYPGQAYRYFCKS